ncbi:hypothetical protein KIPB_004798, partial [Kipferlia bialata]
GSSDKWDSASQGSQGSSVYNKSENWDGASVAQSGISTVSSASFFGSQHERYLPRLVVDLDVIRRGLGVAESHESPLQQVVWASLSFQNEEEQIASLVRLAIVLACGLPAQVALPLDEASEMEGQRVEMNVSPYKVFPGGDVTSPISTKFTSEKTLFSRVLLHIPGDMIKDSAVLRQTVSSFNNGLIPPVFSRAALGQLYLTLGEKYVLPQPDAAVLTMKLAQHMGVIVTTRHSPPSRLSHGLNMAYPSRLGSLLQSTNSVYRYLESRFGRKIAPDAFKFFFSQVALMFDTVTTMYPESAPQFNQFTMYAMSAMERYWKRAKAERIELGNTMRVLERHEKALLQELEPSPELDEVQTVLAEIRQSIRTVLPRDESKEAEMKVLVTRGAHLAVLYLFSNEFFSHPEQDNFKGLIARVNVLCGVEDMTDVSLSTSLFLAGMASGQYYFMFPANQQMKPFLWLYSGALPSVDSSLLSCVRACMATVHFPQSIPFFDNVHGIEVATCVQMWRDGLLEGLQAQNTSADNRRYLAAMRKKCQIAVLNLDLPTKALFPIAMKSLETGAHIIFHSNGAPTADAQHFFDRVITLYTGRNTKPGQMLRFLNGKYLVRLKQPVHKLRVFVAFKPELYKASNTFLDCRPIKPTLTLEILDVFQKACPDSETGPLQEAALTEDLAHSNRNTYWKDLKEMTKRLVNASPSVSASVPILRSAKHLLRLAQGIEDGYHAVPKLWARPGIDYGLVTPVRMIEGHFANFPVPILAGYASVKRQMKFLANGIGQFVKEKGYGSLTVPAVSGIFSQSFGHMMASTINPNSLFGFGQFQVLMLLFNLISMVMRGDIEVHSSAACMYAMAQNWDALQAKMDVSKLVALTPLLEKRQTPLAKYPILKEAFTRLTWLEAAGPVFSGICSAVLESDAAFAEAVLICGNIDAGVEVLASIIGTSNKREAVMANGKPKHKLRLPDMLGTAFNDSTVALKYAVVCCLNPHSALVSIGAWLRAFTSVKYIQLGFQRMRENKAKALANAKALG